MVREKDTYSISVLLKNRADGILAESISYFTKRLDVQVNHESLCSILDSMTQIHNVKIIAKRIANTQVL